MDLISAAYGELSDEDSSDPWASARVSTKRTIKDVESAERLPKKQATFLPRPQFYEEVTAQKHVDISSEHGNRVRSFPHERGNWATFVFIPWENSKYVLETVGSCLKAFQESGIELNRSEDLHISLTRTVILRHHWIQDFVSSVRKAMANTVRFSVHAKNFSVYTNEEKTRTFFAFDVHDFSSSLDVLVQSLDTCLQEYNLPTYYANPSHHVSIGWCIGDRKAEIEQIVNQLRLSLENMSTLATEVHCKIGNLLYTCNLK